MPLKYKYKVGDIVQIIGEQRPGQAEWGLVGTFGEIIELHPILDYFLFEYNPGYKLEIRNPGEIIDDEIFEEICLQKASSGEAFIYLINGNEKDLTDM